MNMYTEEEFYKYKGDDEFLTVSYYGKATVRKHKEYSEYVEAFNELCLEDRDVVKIPRELLLYLQERVDPQNEYAVWMMINEYLGEEDVLND